MSLDRRSFVSAGLGSLAAILGMPIAKSDAKAKKIPADAVTVITHVEEVDGVTRFHRNALWVKNDKLHSVAIDYIDVSEDFDDEEEESSSSSESSDSESSCTSSVSWHNANDTSKWNPDRKKAKEISFLLPGEIG